MKVPAPHLAARCPCGHIAAIPVSAEVAKKDPVEMLRSLAPKDLSELLAFLEAHKAHGEVEPCLIEIEEWAQA